MRIALGCMRLSTERERDEARALSVLRAALDAGVVVFDTAHAYGVDASDLGHNERLLGRVIRDHEARLNATSVAHSHVRVVTKCGMRRDGGAWLPDGRASRIALDVEASLEALGGVPIDTLLLHAPDPRVSLATSARALARALEKGQARRIGVSNVSRKQLEEIVQVAPIAAVEVALGAHDDLAVRNGVVRFCLERRLELFAHAPLGGPERATRLARDRVLTTVAAAHPVASPLEVFLAYLLAVNGELVPVIGARRTESIAGLVAASRLVLGEDQLLALDLRFPVLGALRRPPPRLPARATGSRPPAEGSAAPGEAPAVREVVLMMGVPGAGKSSAAALLEANGYERLNRDTLGGTLRGIVRRLDERLRAGSARIVLDNTYVTRATRYDVVRVAHEHGSEVRCVFFDTPPHEAQVNVILRMLGRFGSVLDPSELAARSREDPTALAPHAVQRMTRDLERPAGDEGFASIEIVPFVRQHAAAAGRAGVAIALEASEAQLLRALDDAPAGAPCLLYGWRPEASDTARAQAEARAASVASATGRIVEVALCTHPAGPPICWCRPPLPGSWLAFAHRHGLDARTSVLFGATASERSLARAVGLRFVALS